MTSSFACVPVACFVLETMVMSIALLSTNALKTCVLLRLVRYVHVGRLLRMRHGETYYVMTDVTIVRATCNPAFTSQSCIWYSFCQTVGSLASVHLRLITPA